MRLRITNEHQRPIANCAKTRKGPKTLILHNCSKTKKVPLLPILLVCGYTHRVQKEAGKSSIHLVSVPTPTAALRTACSWWSLHQHCNANRLQWHFMHYMLVNGVLVIAKRVWNIQSQLQNGEVHVDMCYMCALAKHCLATTITWELCNFREHRQPTSCHSVALWQWQTSTQGLIRKMKNYSWIVYTKT